MVYKTTFFGDIMNSKSTFFQLLQNFLNESLKFLDKSYPNNGHLSGLHHSVSATSSIDTKPLHLDAKSLLHHGTSTTTSSAASLVANIDNNNKK
jgi:hypothetical protein